jgi:HK97 family phage major capsid protein
MTAPNPSQEFSEVLQYIKGFADDVKMAKEGAEKQMLTVEKLLTENADIKNALNKYSETEQELLGKQAALKQFTEQQEAKITNLEKALEAAGNAAKDPSKSKIENDAEKARLANLYKGLILEHARPNSQPRELIEEAKQVLVHSDARDGGFLVPDTLYNEINRNIIEVSPIRQLARVVNVSHGSAKFPKIDSYNTVYWTAEGEPLTESTPKFGVDFIVAHKQTARFDISLEAMQDAMFDVRGLLTQTSSEKLAEQENLAFVSGDGSHKPYGFTNDPVVTSINSGSASAITLAGVTRILGEIKEAYHRNAVYVMRRETWVAIMILLQANGSSEPKGMFMIGDVKRGIPSMLNGYPVYVAQDMDAIGTDTFPVAFGDFRAGYTIVDVPEVIFAADTNVKMLTTGAASFAMLRRTGGAVVKGEALKLLKCATL